MQGLSPPLRIKLLPIIFNGFTESISCLVTPNLEFVKQTFIETLEFVKDFSINCPTKVDVLFLILVVKMKWIYLKLSKRLPKIIAGILHLEPNFQNLFSLVCYYINNLFWPWRLFHMRKKKVVREEVCCSSQDKLIIVFA